MKGCNCLHANSARTTDPSRTIGLRRQFEAEVRRRFVAVRKALRAEVPKVMRGVVVNRSYDFPSSQVRKAVFMDWFEGVINKEILDGMMDAPASEIRQRAWTNKYAQRAYSRGLNRAASQMSAGGATVRPTYPTNALRRGFHRDRLETAYTRAFNDLKDITSEMSDQIGDVLAQSLADGRHVNEAARMLSDRVNKIGITRARLLARTEVINAHAEAQLNAFEDAGLSGVQLDPELVTAGDTRVCEICEDAARLHYTPSAAHGMIPLHPNCRCAWAPVVVRGHEIELN